MNLLDINKTFDGDHKEWHVHASVWTGCKIMQPEKILTLEDAKAAGYISGLELSFIKTRADLKNYDMTRMEKCMFCIDLPASFTRQKAANEANPINLFGGRPDEAFHAYNFKKPNEVFRSNKPDFPSYFAYEAYFGLDKVNQGRTNLDRSFRDLRESDWIPGTMWPTRIRTYNVPNQVFMLTQRGDGHLDDIELPMRGTLDGKICFKDLHKQSIEMQ